MKMLLLYCVFSAAGMMLGMVLCIASSLSLKWFIVFIIGLTGCVIFFAFRDKRQLTLAAFFFSLPLFVTKKIIYTEYIMIAGGPSAIGIFLYDLPLAVLAILYIHDKMTHHSIESYVSPILIPFAMYTFWSLLSIVQAPEPFLSFIEVLWLVKILFILYLLPNVIRNRSDLITAITMLVLGLMIQEEVTFIQAKMQIWFNLTGDIEKTTLQTTSNPQGFRAGGTVGWHNIQAAYYALMIPFTAGLVLSLKSIHIKIVLILTIIAGLFAIILTYSRNGFLSLAFAFFITTILGWYCGLVRVKQILIALWVMVCVIGIASPFIGKTLWQRVRSKAAISERIETIDIALRMIREHPFLGVGLNNFSIVMNKKTYSPEGISKEQQGYIGGQFFGLVVHNKFLLIASQTGIIGLIFFIIAYFSAYKSAWSLLKDPDVFYRGAGVGLISAISGAAVNMMSDIYNSDILTTIFWVLIGIIFTLQKISFEEKLSQPQRHSWST